jgi:hypothetical protein
MKSGAPAPLFLASRSFTSESKVREQLTFCRRSTRQTTNHSVPLSGKQICYFSQHF